MHTYTADRIVKDPVAITLWLVALLAGLAYASHFVGPAAGWLDRVVAIAPDSAEPPTAPPSPDLGTKVDGAALPGSDGPPPAESPANAALLPPKTLPHLTAVRDDFGAKLSNLSRRNTGSYFKSISVSQENGRLILHLKSAETFGELTEEDRLRVLQAIGLQWGNQATSFEFVRSKRDAIVRLYSTGGDAIVGTADGTLGSAWLE